MKGLPFFWKTVHVEYGSLTFTYADFQNTEAEGLRRPYGESAVRADPVSLVSVENADKRGAHFSQGVAVRNHPYNLVPTPSPAPENNVGFEKATVIPGYGICA